MTETGSSSAKLRAMALLVVAEVLVLSLWFISSATMPGMLAEVDVAPSRQALLSSGVQIGFVAGALASAALGVADRFDPRRVFALSAVLAALANAALPVLEPGGNAAIAMRVITGALMAGVYPVGMKIATGWGLKDRGLLVGILVGALTLGSSLPHLVTGLGGTEWRMAVYTTSAAAFAGGFLVLAAGLGPHHARAPAFSMRAIALAWTDRRIRLAYGGYLGHMWELYVLWAWMPAAAAASFAFQMDAAEATRLATWTAFAAIGLGAASAVWAGWVAGRIGKANVAIIALAASLLAGLATAASFGGPRGLTAVLFVVWGIAVIPDSAQFSALVADAAPPHLAGSLMTFQTALGFLLTFATVQAAPVIAACLGWQPVLAALAIGPALGIAAMWTLRERG
ncbi:MAG: MFS transporter [Anderseniella sp.]|jgi:MFS family permease|nr:MFS transporter [Anderseniella sp.]